MCDRFGVQGLLGNFGELQNRHEGEVFKRKLCFVRMVLTEQE